MNVIRILIKEEKGGFITHGFAKYGDDTTNVLGIDDTTHFLSIMN